jgi:hypothetical protein
MRETKAELRKLCDSVEITGACAIENKERIALQLRDELFISGRKEV